jgi:hypothetical protein
MGWMTPDQGRYEEAPYGFPEKVMTIRRWIDPEERITVDFDDERDLNAEVIECEGQTVTLLLETAFPHYKQHLTLPLSMVSIGEDKTKYTRNPDKPVAYAGCD